MTTRSLAEVETKLVAFTLQIRIDRRKNSCHILGYFFKFAVELYPFRQMIFVSLSLAHNPQHTATHQDISRHKLKNRFM